MPPGAAAAMTLQWGLLAWFTAALLLALLAGWRWRRVRPTAFAVGFLAALHAVYYALFLVWPDVLGPFATMLYSIALRWVVGFVIAFVLVIAVKRETWKP